MKKLALFVAVVAIFAFLAVPTVRAAEPIKIGAAFALS